MSSLRDEIGDFVGIPNSFIEDEQQTAESRVVFMLLRYHTHRKRKRAFPGFETLMRETGLKRQKTAEGIAVLVKTGWLIKHRQFGRPTEYELRYPEGRDSSTGELSRDLTIVPPADVDSSTGGSSPLINTKTEFTKTVPPPKKRSHQPPELAAIIDAPYHSKEFMEALALYEKHISELGSKITPTQRDELYRILAQCGGEEVAIEAIRLAVRNGWKGIFPEKLQQNGNGYHYESASERNVRYIRESLADSGISIFPENGNHSSTAMLLAVRAKHR